MTGTELRYRLGAYYAEQEQQNGVPSGLLSTCHRLGDPDFCRRSRRRQRVPEFDEALGHAATPVCAASTDSTSICMRRSSRPARIIAGDCSRIPRRRWPR